jgi:hypothetical protein
MMCEPPGAGRVVSQTGRIDPKLGIADALYPVERLYPLRCYQR